MRDASQAVRQTDRQIDKTVSFRGELLSMTVHVPLPRPPGAPRRLRGSQISQREQLGVEKYQDQYTHFIPLWDISESMGRVSYPGSLVMFPKSLGKCAALVVPWAQCLCAHARSSQSHNGVSHTRRRPSARVHPPDTSIIGDRPIFFSASPFVHLPRKEEYK